MDLNNLKDMWVRCIDNTHPYLTHLKWYKVNEYLPQCIWVENIEGNRPYQPWCFDLVDLRKEKPTEQLKKIE